MKKTELLTLLFFICTSLNAQIWTKYGPYLQNVKENEATIVWEANKNSIGWVEIAPDDGTHFYSEERPKYFDSTSGVKNSCTLHTVRVTGLKPGTSYRYRIYSKEILTQKGTYVTYGGVAASNVYSQKPLCFTTCDTKKEDMTFAVINDIHARKGLLTELLKLGDYENKELIIYNGDMVSEMPNPQSIFDGFMNESIELFAKEKPMYYARGNHETRGESATMFQKYFSPKEPHLYFTLRHGPVCFIILDTGEDKPDSDIEYFGITDYDNYRTEQMEWIKTLANDKDVQGATYKIAIAHMPPTQDATTWHGPRDVLRKFVPTLNELGIDLMLTGHLHRYLYQDANDVAHFPIIVNSNETVISAKADKKKLELTILDRKGKEVTHRVYLPK